MVGRDRFIDFASISEYAGVAKIARESKVLTIVQKVKEEVEKKKVATHPRLDPVGLLVGSVVLAGLVLFFATTPLGRNALRNSYELASRHGEITAQTEFEAIDGSASVISSVSALGKKSDVVYLGYLNSLNQKIVAIWSALRDKVLAILAPLIGTPVSETKFVVGSATTTISSTATASATAGAQDALTAEEVRMIAKEVANQEIAKTIDYTSGSASSNMGVVTVPSSGNAGSDAAITQKVKDSFSDQVSVTLDASKSSGIIRPIFKNPTDDRYLFVVVPVSQTP